MDIYLIIILLVLGVWCLVNTIYDYLFKDTIETLINIADIQSKRIDIADKEIRKLEIRANELLYRNDDIDTLARRVNTLELHQFKITPQDEEAEKEKERERAKQFKKDFSSIMNYNLDTALKRKIEG